MPTLKRIGAVLIFPALLFSSCMCVLYADTIKDLPNPKFPFHEAIAALQKGHTIHRAGERKKTMKRKIEMDGKTYFQYGYTWNDDDFKTSLYFSTEDVMANDWIIDIIEENK